MYPFGGYMLCYLHVYASECLHMHVQSSNKYVLNLSSCFLSIGFPGFEWPVRYS